MDFWVDVDCKLSLVQSMVLILQKHDVRVLKNYDLYDRVGESVDLMFVS